MFLTSEVDHLSIFGVLWPLVSASPGGLVTWGLVLGGLWGASIRWLAFLGQRELGGCHALEIRIALYCRANCSIHMKFNLTNTIEDITENQGSEN